MHLVVWIKLNLLYHFKWIPFPTQSCLSSTPFMLLCFIHSFMWLTLSSLSPHNLHLLFCCVLSVFALTQWALMIVFCDTIKRDSISLLRFPFLNSVQVFPCAFSPVLSLEESINFFFQYTSLSLIVVVVVFVTLNRITFYKRMTIIN